MEKLTGKDLTQRVADCNSWMELKSLIKSQAPFISWAKITPKEWPQEKILTSMELVRSGAHINLITRANGLRAKVAELILGKNYGDPWE